MLLLVAPPTMIPTVIIAILPHRTRRNGRLWPRAVERRCRYHGEYWGHSGPAEVIGIPTVLIRKKHSVSRRASDSEAFLLTCYVALRADVKGKSATYCFSETPMV